ncbi:uncharacterized protein TNCV_565191 [Trichonephila clavipes]|nr:uncharacterized protein TNCV_565191 [Trichonephila clavipes]
MATGSYLTQNHSRSQSEIQGIFTNSFPKINDFRSSINSKWLNVNFRATVVQWPRYQRSLNGRHVMSSNPVPIKTHRVGQRCTLNLPRAETSSRWCGVVVKRGGASSGVVHVT